VAPYATSKTWCGSRNIFGRARKPTHASGSCQDRRVYAQAVRAVRQARACVSESRTGRAVDAMTDAHQYMHGRDSPYMGPRQPWRFRRVLARDGRNSRASAVLQGLQEARTRAASPARRLALRQGRQDLYEPRPVHLRSLLMTDPVDAMIANARQVCRARCQDSALPLRLPHLRRVNLHRRPSSATRASSTW